MAVNVVFADVVADVRSDDEDDEEEKNDKGNTKMRARVNGTAGALPNGNESLDDNPEGKKEI